MNAFMDTSSALNFLQKALPWIGAVATSDVPALIGLAAGAVSKATGKPVEHTAEAITAAVANATPEQLLALKVADDEVRLKSQALGFQNQEEMRRLQVQEETLDVGDAADARRSFAQKPGVFYLGIMILLTFAGMMGFSIYGCYQILVGGITLHDIAAVAAIANFLGIIIGYVASNAQQVVNYFFGSTHASAAKSDQMAAAFKDLSQAAKSA